MIKAEEAIITVGNEELTLEKCEIYPPDNETPYWYIVPSDGKKIVISGTVMIQYE